MKNIIKKFLPEFVYGSVDGVVTTVAIVTAAVGAGLSSSVIFILGLANVLADAWSMGSSEYLSSISEAQMEGDNYDDEGKTPLAKAGVTFGSFVTIGLLPVIPFLISVLAPGFRGSDIYVSLVAALFSFIIIGYVGARVTGTSHVRNIIRTVIVGSVAALISFLVGYLLRNLE
jgi:vacuolar iron transporter family protein